MIIEKYNKRQLESDQEQLKMELFQEFLFRTKAEKWQAIEKLHQELGYIEEDMRIVTKQITTLGSDNSVSHRVPDFGFSFGIKQGTKKLQLNNRQALGVQDGLESDTQIKFDRINKHLPDLQESYFGSKLKKDVPAVNGDLTEEDLVFANSLVQCTKFTGFRTLANLHYADHFFNYSSSIVSSIGFDKDDELFATGGVTKKLKIYDYASVIEKGNPKTSSNINKNWDEFLGYQDNDEVPRTKYPIREMQCQAKISCLAWNSYIKSLLISSDYEGSVSLWDTATGQCTVKFEEHEKRIWSVDFSDVNPTVAASGSDDARVKLWSNNLRYSTHTIESKANVCSVKFHPTNSNYLVFGSADHHLHYYDLRKLIHPVKIFTGHKKAVSYVKFLNSNELISASTDCSLRLWLTNGENDCKRVFKGHTNEKNFVGLSVNCNSEFIGCGSETNQIFVYHSQLNQPITDHRFENTLNPVTVS